MWTCDPPLKCETYIKTLVIEFIVLLFLVLISFLAFFWFCSFFFFLFGRMHSIKSFCKKPLKLYDHIVNSNEYLSKKALVIDFGNEFNGFATLNLDLSVVPRAMQLECLQRSELFSELMSEAIRELMSCFVKLTCILPNMQVHDKSLSPYTWDILTYRGRSCI